ncbi:VOC family protein [bacterium]|nr:MAG: VOC family protein [bacterium]
MKFEHVAFNVAFPIEMAAWYVQHLGMRILRSSHSGTMTHFLVDEAGRAIVEIYKNPPNEVPDYAAMNPLQFHLAFVSTDPIADQSRLLEAGATLVENLHLEDGSHLVMMRDPWGVALQLCKRGRPLLETS